MNKLTQEQKDFLLKQKEQMRKRPKRRPIWSRSEVDEGKEYVLLLLENENGLREFELREKSKKNEKVIGSKCVFITEVIPYDLLWRGDLYGIAENIGLENGESFHFDSLGNWGTEQELEEFKKI
ncbi:hypothetical protein [Aliikangiella maris]|uniref:Uncharacterized protein n=2 Tax=Aliikangiella maris TaxID=3162458 RepID=A0ABV3MS87_9GAMM